MKKLLVALLAVPVLAFANGGTFTITAGTTQTVAAALNPVSVSLNVDAVVCRSAWKTATSYTLSGFMPPSLDAVAASRVTEPGVAE